jgi:biopolymer transport protein ExbB/TolQ
MTFSYVEMWATMGWGARGVVIVLALMSIYSLGVTVERLFALRKSRQQSIRYADLVARALDADALNDAIAAATPLSVGYLPRVISAGLSEYTLLAEQEGRHAEEVLELTDKALERTSVRVMADLKRGLGGLATVASCAPFVGLFGTVLGIINAFTLMATKGSGGLATVSAGISEALVTTAFGLFVAIPAVALYNYFNSAVEAINVDMTEASGEVMAHLARRQGLPSINAA